MQKYTSPVYACVVLADTPAIDRERKSIVCQIEPAFPLTGRGEGEVYIMGINSRYMLFSREGVNYGKSKCELRGLSQLW